MQMIAFCFRPKRKITKTVLIMKLTAILIVAACLQVNAKSYSQNVTLSFKNTPLQKVFKEIKRQTGYNFLCTTELLDMAGKVDLEVKNISFQQALQKCLQNTPLTYTIVEKTIVIKQKEFEKPVTAVDETPAPDIPIKGRVTDENGSPLQGTSVTIKGNNKGVNTDANGEFTIDVPENSSTILVFSFVGREKKEVSIAGKTFVSVVLRLTLATQDEVIVIGYGSQRKIDITAPVSNVSGKEIAKQPSVNPISGLQGKVAGVQITNDGSPGSSPQIRVRGVGSVSFNPSTGTSSASPLYVVDGVWTNDIGFLSSSDIENISILKDASAAAIYGNRSANGVVIVTTKRGKTGSPLITYNGSVGLQKITNQVKMANAFEYATLANEIYASQNNGSVLYDSTTLYQPGVSDPNGTNWFGQLFREAVMTNHNISFRGSTEKVSYAYSISYVNQNGLSKNQNYERITAKLQNEFKTLNILKIGYNLFATFSNLNDVPKNIFGLAYVAAPIVPVRYADGRYGDPADYSIRAVNPQVVLDYYHPNIKDNTLIGNTYLDLKLSKTISFHSNFNFEYRRSDYSNYVPKYQAGAFAFNQISSLEVRHTDVKNWQWENLLQYENTFLSKHKVRFLLGQSTRADRIYWMGGTAKNVPNDYQGQHYLSLGDNSSTNPSTVSDGGDYATGVSYFSRLNYAFDGKYLLTATYRADGSSKYTGKERWGYFPSVGLGWVISNERFMEDQHFADNIKLRASWGVNGNINVPSNITTLTASPVNSAIFGNAFYPSRSITSLVPSQLLWEKAVTTDVGVEAAFLNNRLTTEIDWYSRESKDVIFTTQVLGSSGLSGSGYTANQATINNKGLELSITWSDKIGKDFNYSISANASYNANEVTKVNSGGQLFGGYQGYDGSQTTPASKPITLTQEGLPVGSFYGWRSVGVFQTNAEATAYGQSGAKAGDIKFEDVDGNKIIDDRDRIILGNPNPRYLYGINLNFNYKQFDFAIDLQGVAGVDIYNANIGNVYSIGNFTKDFYNNRWHGEGTSNSYPTADLQHGSNTFPNSFYISKGDYIRVRNIQLGYNILSLKKYKISSLRIYSALQNPFNFFKYKGFSPEVVSYQGNPLNSGIDAGVYPLSAIYNFGINVTF
jgi:TonB-linked SusC/RagA family outer membrane protein